MSKSKDPVHQQIILGTTASAAAAVVRARDTGTLLVVWQNDQIEEIDPNKISQLQSDNNKKKQ